MIRYYYVYVLEKAMAPHSSTLAWKIPWTEEPVRLQSMGSLRVGHDWATSLSLFTFMHRRRKWQPTPVFLPGESRGRGKPGRLSSLGSHRVGHDWNELAACLRLYGSGESLLLRSIFQQLTILVDVLINYKLLVTLFWLIYYLIVTLQIWGLCWWLSW